MAVAERDLIVSQWRSSRGRKFQRVAWGAAEAASIADMPTRTLQHYRSEGLVDPSVLLPEHGVLKPMYCAFDVLRARVLWDLVDAGVPRIVAEEAATDLRRMRDHWQWEWSEAEQGAPFVPCWDAKKTAEGTVVLMVPTDRELIDLALDEEPDEGRFRILTWLDEDDVDEEMPGVLLYPLSHVAGVLHERIEAWWKRVPFSNERRPPWMG